MTQDIHNIFKILYQKFRIKGIFIACNPVHFHDRGVSALEEELQCKNNPSFKICPHSRGFTVYIGVGLVGLALVVRCWLTMRKVVSSTPAQGNLHSAGLEHKYACHYVHLCRSEMRL